MRTATLLILVAALAGCASFGTPSAPPPKSEPVAIAEPAGPKATDPPSTWTKGKVYRVWPFGQGELMAYLGSKDGLRVGDTLSLQRGGKSLNTVEAITVNEETFYGRAINRSDEGAMPKEGDIVVKVPRSN
jgi:hypothetical protein